ncbi:Capsid polyprotein [Salix suchowensis]|nr:Capsid polyprotein [Salix suchowensis]
MSRMRTDRKPPLAKSPIRIRPRRVLRPNPSLCKLLPSQKPNRKWDTEDSDLRPEYHSISCELRALAKMVRDEFGNGEPTNGGVGRSLSVNSSPLFERGRFYEEYSARRNDRLKRKKGDTGDDVKTPYNLGVTVKSTKRRDTRKLESTRKSVSDAYLENKKPPLPVYSFEKSVLAGERKVATRKVRKT